MWRNALLFLALISGTAQAEQSQRFDLICTGAGNPQHKDFLEPVDLHLRVDLAAKHWCEGDCKVIHDVADIQPAQLWLEKESPADEQQRLINSRAVDRENGSYIYIHEFFILDRKSTVAQDSHCEPAPFSGFPKIETKF